MHLQTAQDSLAIDIEKSDPESLERVQLSVDLEILKEIVRRNSD